MTLRLSPAEDLTLARLAKASQTSKNSAAAAAIDLAASKSDHRQFVRESTDRLLRRYSGLIARLSEA